MSRPLPMEIVRNIMKMKSDMEHGDYWREQYNNHRSGPFGKRSFKANVKSSSYSLSICESCGKHFKVFSVSSSDSEEDDTECYDCLLEDFD